MAHGVLAAAFMGAVMGISVWRGMPPLPIEIDVATAHVDELSELPLGLAAPGTPGGGAAPPAEPVPPPDAPPDLARAPPAPARSASKAMRVAANSPPDAGAGAATTPPRVRPTSVRSYAPEGSRVVALVRLDRLRGTPYAAPVDSILRLLPDRRDLLEGTDLDLYRDVDALLVATPNPLDAFATLLVVRHRLADADLRRALDKGARATGRRLVWHTQRGRPFAERVAATVAGSQGPGGDPAPLRRRDERLILLAAPRLAVVTPPSYRRLLLGGGSASAKGQRPASAVDAGAIGGTADASDGRPAAAQPGDEDDWASLVDRIDAEDSILPENAVAMLSVAGVFVTAGTNRLPTPTAQAVPGTRGEVDDRPLPATVRGLPAPRLLTVVLGIAPQFFADIDAEFETPEAGARWQQEWPQIRHQLLSNALVVLTGLAHIISAVTVDLAESTLRIRVEATEDEMIRILTFLAAQLPRFGP